MNVAAARAITTRAMQMQAMAGGSCFTLATRLALANLDFNISLGDEMELDLDGPDPDRQPLGQCLCILLLLQTPE
uniref:Uncharacterized protein n=1 Tax=Oryza punctata TaxID=4537 RepID=A0A0E0M9G1_ORYPU